MQRPYLLGAYWLHPARALLEVIAELRQASCVDVSRVMKSCVIEHGKVVDERAKEKGRCAVG